VALQQEKRLYSRFSVLVERIDISVRYNLNKTHSDSDVVTGSVPRMVSSRRRLENLTMHAASSAAVAVFYPGAVLLQAGVAVHC